MKLFLTGPIEVGKTHITNGCLAAFTGKLWGFRTYKEEPEGMPGESIVWLSEAAHPEHRWIAASIRDGGENEFWPEVFETRGVDILRKIGPDTEGMVLMDEIGHIESNAPAFQNEVKRVLDLDIPVLGVLRQDSTPFLDELFADRRLTIVDVTTDNRDALPAHCRKLLGLKEQRAHRPVSVR